MIEDHAKLSYAWNTFIFPRKAVLTVISLALSVKWGRWTGKSLKCH
jgi:hypothetical protein